MRFNLEIKNKTELMYRKNIAKILQKYIDSVLLCNFLRKDLGLFQLAYHFIAYS